MKSPLLFALFGLAYGAVLQRSGFCFARAGFEYALLRSRDAINGVLAGLIVGTAGFGLVMWARPAGPGHPGPHLVVLPLGPGTVVGGVLFGLGMSLAGMCVAGTLVRLGEGYAIAWATLAGIVIGAALDPLRTAIARVLQNRWFGVWLGHWLTAPGASLFTLVFLIVIWLSLARRRGKKPGDRRESPLHIPAPVVGGLLLGLLNTLQMALVAPWTVSYPLALVWSGTSSETLRWAIPLAALDVGIVAGALVSGAAGDGVRLRVPRRRKDVLLAVLGGLLMGWGVRLAGSCNIGGIFSALPSLSLSAWLFLPAVVVGARAGARLVQRLE
jgi:hypothetical protein